MTALRCAIVLTVTCGLVLGASARLSEGDTVQAGQAAADVLRDETGTDGAFLAAGLMKESYSADNLASALQYPSDEVVVIALKGSQIRQAFERSLSLYPHPSTSVLHISSGFEVVFQSHADPGKRVVSVTLNSTKLDESKTYDIAMPAQLGRGGLGYFKIWDKTKIVRTISGKTIEDLMRGKKVSVSKPRWTAQG